MFHTSSPHLSPPQGSHGPSGLAGSLPQFPKLFSFMALWLATSAPVLAATPAQDLAVPIVVEETTGIAQPAAPVAGGIPLPEGMLADAVPLEVDGPEGALRIPATGRVLARWPDASVQWMLVEFEAPELRAGEVFTGTLRVRGNGLSFPGKLEITPAANGVPITVDNGIFRLLGADGQDELFRVDSPDGGSFSAPATMELLTEAGHFNTNRISQGNLEVEDSDEFSVTLVRRDLFLNKIGRDTLRVTTRLTLWRNDPALRIRQTLDVLGGVHRMQSWTLKLPFADPGNSMVVALDGGRVRTLIGDASGVQDSWEHFRYAGRRIDGGLPGVVQVRGATLAMRHFRELYPSGIIRGGNEIRLEYCPGKGKDAVVLEEGFSRTMEDWIWFGKSAATPNLEQARARNETPLRLRSTPEWYTSTDAFGRIGMAIPGEDADLEELIADSTDEILEAREVDPEHGFGFQNFGDFFDRQHTIAYYGALQQEYDPGMVMLVQFLRTGSLSYLEPGLDCAEHYADVDMSWYGGAFQHRATKNHVESWIASIFADSFRAQCYASPYYDGTLDGVFKWVRHEYSPGAAATLERWTEREEALGAKGEEIEDRVFLMVGYYTIEQMRESLPPSPDATIHDYAAFFASLQQARDLGFTDPDSQFLAFFDIYGGDWDHFPNFHVDNGPIPKDRHQGGHSLIQGVLLGYLLSGDPHLGEMALAFAEHHATQIVPEEVKTFYHNRDDTDGQIYARSIAWPLLNLESLMCLVDGDTDLASLRDEMLNAERSCVDALITTDVGRYDSSVHAGMTLEALTMNHQRTGDPAVRDYLTMMAQRWAREQYDWDSHSFRHKAVGKTETYKGMSGLLVYPLAYAETLEHDQNLYDTLMDAWDHMAQLTDYAKAYAMLYRGVGHALPWIRDLRASTP